MMYGRLKPFLRKKCGRFAPVDVGQPTVHDDEIRSCRPFGPAPPLVAVIDRNFGNSNSSLQSQLLDQRRAQLGVVIHYQGSCGFGLAGPGSNPPHFRRAATRLREVEHSGVKEASGLRPEKGW